MASVAKILIVEDQYFVAMDAEQTLLQAGYECVGLAANAAEALQMARGYRPDLILMDINLAGGVDGVEAAIDIFRQLGIRSVFASAHADAITRAQAQSARPLGWLDKPYSASGLLHAIEEGLAQLAMPGDARPREGEPRPQRPLH